MVDLVFELYGRIGIHFRSYMEAEHSRLQAKINEESKNYDRWAFFFRDHYGEEESPPVRKRDKPADVVKFTKKDK